LEGDQTPFSQIRSSTQHSRIGLRKGLKLVQVFEVGLPQKTRRSSPHRERAPRVWRVLYTY